MKRLAAIGLIALAGAPSIRGDERLSLKVSPVMALAPASVTIRAIVEPNEANRLLSIAVISGDYERTSEVPLEGKNAPRLNVFELRDLPTGLYEVQATLVGESGRIAATTQLMKVQQSPGHSR